MKDLVPQKQFDVLVQMLDDICQPIPKAKMDAGVVR